MNKFKLFIAALICCTSLTSCMSYAFAEGQQEVIEYSTDEADYVKIVTYGTPHYVDNTLAYYFYRNMYYYPYFHNNNWYFYPYRTIQPRGYVHRPSHPEYIPEARFGRPNNFQHRRENERIFFRTQPDNRVGHNFRTPQHNQQQNIQRHNNINIQRPNFQRQPQRNIPLQRPNRQGNTRMNRK